MRILKLVLDNFANIYTGLHVRHLEIDFSEQTNMMCIIIGRNGRGKTSILSYMSPFASLGNIDVRNGASLILEGEKGYHQLILEDDDKTIYDMQHFHQPVKGGSHTVKSYFAVDGKERNENGNVSSFKAIVSEVLGIEMDHLRLIRIGDNVANLIGAKATERKTFMAKLLDEVDIFLKQHKKMAQKSNEMKAVLSHITDDIRKTGIDDIPVVEQEICDLSKEVKHLEQKESSVADEKSRLLYDLELLNFPNDGEQQIKELQKKLRKYENIFEVLDHGVTSPILTTRIEDIEKVIIVTETKLSSLEERFHETMKELDNYENEKERVMRELEKEAHSLDLRTLREHVVSLRHKVNTSYDTRFESVKVAVTKHEFEDFMRFLSMVQGMLDTIYVFGKPPIKEVLSEMMKQGDVTNLIKSSLIQIEATERAERMSIIDRLIHKFSGRTYGCEDGSCPYRQLYDELMEIRDAIPVTNVTKDEAFYHSMESVYNVLESVISLVEEKEELIQRLPSEIRDIFLIDRMFSHIKELENIYDPDLVNKWLSFLTDLENYVTLQKDLREQESKLRELEGLSRETYLNDQLKNITSNVQSVRERIEGFQETIAELTETLATNKELLETRCTQREALELYEDKKQELQNLCRCEEKYRSLKISILNVETELSDAQHKLTKTRDLVTLKTQAMVRFGQLQKDLKEYSGKLEVYEQLKYALSNRTGLPLFYINLYLRDTVAIANELLDIVYDGDIYLTEFEIREDSFRMPYVKNGIEIPDVSLASQGEKSFFNMAISSALRAQCMERYNIALFDEVDGVFDDENRQKTIPVLEKLMELTHTEQAFLITHNQMFNQYPTDIIDLDNLENSTVSVTWS